MTADIGNGGCALVLVSGMHRSGTSATAGALTLLGAEAGSRLAPARPENSKGFFELLPLVEVHDQILARCGYTWDDPRPLDISSYPRNMRSEARRAILTVIENELSLSGLTVVNDPRAARLIPLWLEVFAELELEPRFLHAYRSPDAVSASLARRSGMADGHARQLWLEHVLAMERDTRGFMRSFVECPSLVSEPVENLARIAVQLDFEPETAVASKRSELEAFLESNLLHHPQHVEKLSDKEAAVLKDLRSLVVRNVGAAQKRLDGIATGEDMSEEAVAHATHLHLDVKQRLAKIIERGALSNERLSDLERSHAERLGQVNRHLGEIDKALDAPELSDVGRLRTELDELHSRTAGGTTKLDSLETSINSLRGSIDGRIQDASEPQRNALKALDSRLDSTERLLHREVRAADRRQQGAQEAIAGMRAEMKRYLSLSEFEAISAQLKVANEAELKAANGKAASAKQDIELVSGRLDSEVDAISSEHDRIFGLLSAAEAAGKRTDALISQLEEQLQVATSSLDEDLSLVRGEVREIRALLQGHEERQQAAVSAVVDKRLAEAVHQLDQVLAESKASYAAELLRFVDLLPTASEFAQLRSTVNELRMSPMTGGEPETAPAPEGAPTEYVVVDDLPAFASQWAPTVSIIIPAFNQSQLTIECLRSIALNPPSVPFEVIVGDDCSTEPEFENVRTIEGVNVVATYQNSGFGANCNNAARHARGKYLYFLNNDAALRPGSVDNLLGTFAHFPKTGIAGSKLVFPDGTTQDAGGIIWQDGSAWNYARGRSISDPASSYCRIADYVAGASLMIPTELFSDLGGFDPRYAPAYYEDVDLCMKVAALDLEVRYQPASVVTHAEGRSYGTDIEQEGKHHQVLNAQRFFDRWQQQLAHHRASGEQPEREKDRAAAQRILAVCPEELTAEQAAKFFPTLEQLTALGNKVVLFAADGPEGAVEELFGALQFMGVEVVTSRHEGSFDNFVAERVDEFDLALFAESAASGYRRDVLRSAAPDMCLMLDGSSLDGHSQWGESSSASAFFDCALIRPDQVMEQGFVAPEGQEVPPILTLPVIADAKLDEDASAIRVIGRPQIAEAQPERWIIDELIPAVGSTVPDVDFQILDGAVFDREQPLAGAFGEPSTVNPVEIARAIERAISDMAAPDRQIEAFQQELAALCAASDS